MIRPAAAADRELLVGWMLAMFGDLKAASADPWFAGAELPVEAAGGYVDGSLAGTGPFLLAERGGVPAGFVTGRIEEPYVREALFREIGHVSMVWVAPAFRRQGVARVLVAAAEAWFRQRGLAWAQLSYSPMNAPASAAWTELGYTPFRVFARKPL